MTAVLNPATEETIAQLPEPAEPAMDGCLRGRRVRSSRQLAERVRGVPESELRGLPKRPREPRQAIFCPQPFDGLELESCRAARSHEIGVVGVGEPIRTRARLGDHGALLERENRLRRSHLREHRLDRLPALRICDRVLGSLGDGELATPRRSRRRETRHAGRRRGSTRDRRRCGADAREEHVVDRRHPRPRGRAGR